MLHSQRGSTPSASLTGSEPSSSTTSPSPHLSRPPLFRSTTQIHQFSMLALGTRQLEPLPMQSPTTIFPSTRPAHPAPISPFPSPAHLLLSTVFTTRDQSQMSPSPSTPSLQHRLPTLQFQSSTMYHNLSFSNLSHYPTRTIPSPYT